MSSESNPSTTPDLPSFDGTRSALWRGPTCTSCSKEIPDLYHERNGAIICSPCRARMTDEMHGGLGLRRGFRALRFGCFGAMLGAAAWYFVLARFDMELGILAIAVGYLVGKGVQLGSRGRGGWKYQTLAVALTYSAIVVTYIPFIARGIVRGGDQTSFADTRAVAGAPAAEVLVDAITPTLLERSVAAADQDGDGDVSELEAERMAGMSQPRGFMILTLIFGAVLFFVMAAAAPILAGFDDIIGLIIIGYALFEAWRLNRRDGIRFAGPFRVGAPRTAGVGVGSGECE